MKEKTAFHEKMKQWRKSTELSQEAAAEAIGVSKTTIQKWEGIKSPTFPKQENIEKILTAYNLTEKEFTNAYAKSLTANTETQSKTDKEPTSALADFMDTTFYSLSPNSFNPIKTNVYVPPSNISIYEWTQIVNKAFCEAYNLGTNSLFLLQEATEVILCICGVTKRDEKDVPRETLDARERIQEVTLAKMFQIVSAMKFGRRPDGASNALLMQWFTDGYNKLKESDIKDGWTPPISRKGNRPYSGPSPSQAFVDSHFFENRNGIENLLLALHPYFNGTLKGMFCCEEDGTAFEEFINGTAMIALEGDILESEEKRFFYSLIKKWRPIYQGKQTAKNKTRTQSEITEEAKKEILELMAEIKQKEKALQNYNSDILNQNTEQKARINVLTECLAEMMKLCNLASLFESNPYNVAGFKAELEKIPSEKLASGEEFRIKMIMELKNKSNTLALPLNQNREQEIKTEETRRKYANEILSSAYEEFMQNHPEKGIAMDTENFISKINEEVRKHVGQKMLEILKLDNSALETAEGMKKIADWADSMKKVVAYIGTTGNSRKALLDKELNDKIEPNIMKSILSTCEEIGLLVKSISTNTGKGRPSPNYVLSYIGKIYFSMLSNEYTNGMPLRQAHIIASIAWANEKSVGHANLIHQTENLLEEFGYDWKDEDEQSITDASDNSICDILATKDGTSVRIECELGHGNPAYYGEKVNKIFSVTPYALFITPNKEVAKSLSGQINEGLGISKSILKSKGKLWEVISYEDAKKKFKDDALWPIRKVIGMTAKKNQKLNALSATLEDEIDWSSW